MTIAPPGVSIRAATVPVTPGTSHVAVVGQRLELFEQSRVGQRRQGLGGRVASPPRSIFSIRSHSRRPVPRSASVWPTWFCVESTGTRYVCSSRISDLLNGAKAAQ